MDAKQTKERMVADFNSEHKAVLDSLLLGYPQVRPFGCPCLLCRQEVMYLSV